MSRAPATTSTMVSTPPPAVIRRSKVFLRTVRSLLVRSVTSRMRRLQSGWSGDKDPSPPPKVRTVSRQGRPAPPPRCRGAHGRAHHGGGDHQWQGPELEAEPVVLAQLHHGGDDDDVTRRQPREE